MEEVPITITVEEIETMRLNVNEELKKEEIAYHNWAVPIIEKYIRETLKCTKTRVYVRVCKLNKYPHKAWKANVLKRIAKKFTDKNIKAYYLKEMDHFMIEL